MMSHNPSCGLCSVNRAACLLRDEQEADAVQDHIVARAA